MDKKLVRIISVNQKKWCARGMLANGSSVYVPIRGGKLLTEEGGEIAFSENYAPYHLKPGDEIWAELVQGDKGPRDLKAWSWVPKETWNSTEAKLAAVKKAT